MGQTLLAKTGGEHAGHPVDRAIEGLLHEDRPIDRVIERLLAENAQLRELVIRLTAIAMRNVVDRK
jgi:hypothetical protein